MKYALKAKDVTGEAKFRALLLLKDLMNNKHKLLVDYVEKKLLKRVSEFSRSEFKENVLLQTNPATEPKVSADFYQLTLECIDLWGGKYGETNAQFLEKRYRLHAEGRLPVKPFFINFPGPDEELVYNNISNFNDDNVETLLNEIKAVREQITAKLLQNNCNSFKNREVEQLAAFYKEAYERLDSHPEKKALINDNENADDPQLDDIKEQLLNELIYYQSFSDLYSGARNPESNRVFYVELQNLNKNFFNKTINIDHCLLPEVKADYVYEPEELSRFEDSNVREMREAEESKFKPEPKEDKKLNKKKKKEQNDKVVYEGSGRGQDDENYAYDRHQVKKEAACVTKKPHSKVTMEFKEKPRGQRVDKPKDTDKENQDLNIVVEKLEKQKRELALKVRNLETDKNAKNSTIRSRSYLSNNVRQKTFANEGFLTIIRTKEDQIATIQEKLKKIEAEHNNLKTHDEDFVSLRSTTNADSKLKLRSRSTLNLSMHKTLPREMTRLTKLGSKTDTSGTEFVNQLYSNINRLLIKPSSRQTIKELSYAF